MSISRQMAYPAMTPGARCVAREMVIAPTGGSTYSPGNVVRFQIPLSAYQYLQLNEGSLKFSVNNTGTAAQVVDHSAFAFFDRTVVTTPTGVVIEDIQNVNRLLTTLMDCQQDQSFRSTAYGAMLLCAAPAAADFANVFERQGVSIANAASATASIPIPLGIALTSEKAFPASAMAGGYLRVELYLTDVNTPMTSPSAAAILWTLSNFELHIPYTELSPEADAAVKASAGAELEFPIFTWAGTVNTVTASSTNTLPIGIRQSQVMYMLGGLFPTAKAATSSRNIGNRCNSGAGSQYSLRLNSEIIPQNTVQYTANSAVGNSAVLAELEKIFRNMSGVYHGSCLMPAYLAVTDAVGASGSWCFGVDLRLQPESVSFGETFVGRNCLTADLSLSITTGAGVIASQLYTWWAHLRRLRINMADGSTILEQ